jgi:hypothetical protein
MKYIYIPKEKRFEDNAEDEITYDEALHMMENNYSDAKYALDNALNLFSNGSGIASIGLTFGEILITQ